MHASANLAAELELDGFALVVAVPIVAVLAYDASVTFRHLRIRSIVVLQSRRGSSVALFLFYELPPMDSCVEMLFQASKQQAL
mmetsp:Transcript_23007/g.40743  ORF Transcript_23007/g.40743 Transcript_23007/m.40743 type:complete len:83 (+) Transcript_23007:67-315(+)